MLKGMLDARRKKRLFLLGILLVTAALVGAVLYSQYSYLQSLRALPELTMSYSTEQSSLPEPLTCLGEGGEGGEGSRLAKEILDAETKIVYLAGGGDAMPDSLWANHDFQIPYVQNTNRNTLFDDSCFYRSPGQPADCQGGDCYVIADILDYDWIALSEIVGVSCYPAAGCDGNRASAGYVSITTIAKCHQLVFAGPLVYELDDGAGNLSIMHATETGTPDLDTVELPAGWQVTARSIDEPLELLPFGGGDACLYNIIRDNLEQTYHQYVYAGAEYP